MAEWKATLDKPDWPGRQAEYLCGKHFIREIVDPASYVVHATRYARLGE